MTDEPRLQTQPRGGVPDVTDTLEGFREVCDRLAGAAGPLAADAERASGFRYGHEDWLVQFKREGAGIVLLDPVALTRAGADWGMFNDAVGDAVWILHDSLQDLPGFADIGLTPQALFDTEIAARMLGLHRFGLAAVTEHYLGVTLAKEHSAADWSYRPLPRDWRNYAALDVELLIELRRKMQRELKSQGKDGWADEEFRYATADRHGTQTGASGALAAHIAHQHRQPGPSGPRRGQGAVGRRRDELARAYDIAPGLLLSDDSIVEAASRKPRNAREFRMIRSLNERVRMRTGGEQDKMFERYAPIQRKVKPSVWRETIRRALELPPSQWPVMPAPVADEEHANAPRSMKLWATRHPQRMRLLQDVRKVVSQIADDTRTPAEIIVKPQILRNLCWTDEPRKRDVAEFLKSQGARDWQVNLIAASVSRVIM